MRRELLLPLALLALGLAAAGGFFAAAAALSEGDGREGAGPLATLQEPEASDEVAPPRLLRRAFAGLVLVEEVDGGGVRIREVMPGSPAAAAGLEKDDVITAIDGRAVDTVEAVREALADKDPGDEVTFSLRRDGQEQDVAVTLRARPGAVSEPPGPPVDVPPGHLGRPFLGVRLADVTVEIREELDLPRGDGVAIVDVVRGGPADAAGLRRGDVILRIGSRRVNRVEQAVDALLDHEPGDEVPLLIRRGGQELHVEVELGARRGLGPPLELTPGLRWERGRGAVPGPVTPEMLLPILDVQ